MWPARNRSVHETVIICKLLIALFRDGLDVMIKAISHKDEGANEAIILKYLSSDVRPINHTFSSLQPEFQNVSDGLNFCIPSQMTWVTPFYLA
jgi:hypothetical protein